MVLGNGLGFELAQSSLDLCGSQFHRILLRVGFAPQATRLRATGPPTSKWSNACHRSPAETHVRCPAAWSTDEWKWRRNAAGSNHEARGSMILCRTREAGCRLDVGS